HEPHVSSSKLKARSPEPELKRMDIELQLAVENLLGRYAHARDDDRLEEWPGFFVENGCYRVTTAENHARGLPVSLIYADSRAMLRDRVSALRHANIY